MVKKRTRVHIDWLSRFLRGNTAHDCSLIPQTYTIGQETLERLLHTIEPFTDESIVLLALLPHGSMTGVLKGHPLGLLDLPEVISNDKVLSHILTSIDDERRNPNFVQPIGDIPTAQSASGPRQNFGQHRETRDSGPGCYMLIVTVGSPPSPVSLSPKMGSKTALSSSLGIGRTRYA